MLSRVGNVDAEVAVWLARARAMLESENGRKPVKPDQAIALALIAIAEQLRVVIELLARP